MKKIAIIGFGRFGKLTAELLKKDFKVFVTDKIDKEGEARKLGVKFVTLKEAASQNVVILAVPISDLKDVLLKIKPFLKKGTLVLDTCSLKEYPLNLMKKILRMQLNLFLNTLNIGENKKLNATYFLLHVIFSGHKFTRKKKFNVTVLGMKEYTLNFGQAETFREN